MFSAIATQIDSKAARLVLAAVLVGSVLLLGPFVAVLLVVGIREPRLFLIGLAGAAGLLGAFFRIGAGRRFFMLTKYERTGIAICIASGVLAAFFAGTALPGNVYLGTLSPVVGLIGLLLLAGSIKSSASGA